ncbi:hypothetical protein Tco_0688952 [Tanacetum coccineum]
MWIISRGVVLLILLMLGIGFTSSSDHNNSRQNTSSTTTFIYKTLIIPSFLDSCFISSMVSEDKREMVCCGSQDLCLRQELLEYIGVHDNDASESSQPSWEKMFSPYKGSNHGLLSNLSKSPREILAIEKAAIAFDQPPCMVESRRSRNMSKYYHFHEDHRNKERKGEGLRYLLGRTEEGRQGYCTSRSPDDIK